ncbi:MAG: autotransporter assembly complex family protein [Oleiphilaceae bacterium]|nr:autotransporter assembly complex family protein [Oleiphilaceae bacterium]
MMYASPSVTRRQYCLFLAVVSLLLLAAGPSQAARLEIRTEPENEAVAENIRAYIGPPGERDAAGLRRFSRHARSQADKAMRALGYYQGQVRFRVIEEDPPVLRLNVTLGEPVRLREVTLRVEGEAADMPAFNLPQSLQLKPGDVLKHNRYEAVKRYYNNQALRFGFFDGRFATQRLRVFPEEGVADVALVYTSGPRYTLGQALFPEDSEFSHRLLQRFVQFEPGDPYDSDEVVQLSRDLRGSNYFQTVLVDADPDQAEERQIPVDVDLTPRKPHSLNAGLGYSTDVGPRLRAGWTQHYLNDMGHRRGAEMEVSEPRQNIGAFYEIPLDPPMTDSLRFTGGYQTETIQDTESERFTLGVQWSKRLDSGWQRVVSLRREQDNFRAGDEPRRSTGLLLPGLGFTRLVRDSPTDPSRGYRLQLQATGAQRSLFSDVDILNLTADARGLVTLFGGHRFLARASLGAVATNEFDRVPPSLRFFAGGDQSVRGYGYQSLTPRDEDNNRIGGRFKMVGSVEYQYPLSKSWRLATFADHGAAVDSLDDPLKTGVGFGIRWISPVGPLRLDLARSLDAPERFRLHFSMGPEL